MPVTALYIDQLEKRIAALEAQVEELSKPKKPAPRRKTTKKK